MLAATPQCQQCVVKQYFRYAMGRMETPADGPTLDRIYQEFKNSDFRFKEMVLSMVRLREFPDKERGTSAASNR